MSHNTQKYINRVCEYRGLPKIEKGMRCEVEGKPGTIIGGNCSANLNVRFDGWKITSNCHPYWKIKIFSEDGSVFYDSELCEETK